jgi:hypothetical protein
MVGSIGSDAVQDGHRATSYTTPGAEAVSFTSLFFVSLVVLGFEHWTLCLLGRRSTT